VAVPGQGKAGEEPKTNGGAESGEKIMAHGASLVFRIDMVWMIHETVCDNRAIGVPAVFLWNMRIFPRN
jgi:hypothetical protein